MGQQADDNNRGAADRTALRDLRTGYRRSGPAEFGRENASACVTACFDELVPHVEDVCRQLQQPDYQRSRLWDLYCCDSINCGVYIGDIGQSPNVDLIINECQNIGFFSIEDPGPPPTNYCAPSTLNTYITSSLPHTQTVDPSLFSALRTLSLPSHTSEASMQLAPTSSLSSSSTSTDSSTSSNSNSSRLPRGAKVAIGIFSVIAVLAITVLLLLLYRWRRKSSRSSSPRPLLIPYDNPSYTGPRSASRTPLITRPPSASSKSTPLTPPAKLSDRRYLQPVLKKGTPRPSASASEGDGTFPSSPILAPKSILRHGRRATTSNMRLSTTTKAPVPPYCPTSSVYSSGSGLGASSVTIESHKASGTPPLSAKRLPQAHDRPLELSDLVTPAGPPPIRALPALPTPPLNHPNSPKTLVPPLSPQSPQSSTFPARSPARGDAPAVPKQQRNTAGPQAPISAKELCELTESYAQEARESWGSWSGVGGGGPGVIPLGRKRGSAEKNAERKTAAPIQDLDLEKLSGRY